MVRGELDAYGAGLADKPEVVALNQADLVDAKRLAKVKKAVDKASGGDAFADLRRRPAKASKPCSTRSSSGSATRPERSADELSRRAAMVAALKLARSPAAPASSAAQLIDAALAAGYQVRALTRGRAAARRRSTGSSGALDRPRRLDAAGRRAPTRSSTSPA